MMYPTQSKQSLFFLFLFICCLSISSSPLFLVLTSATTTTTTNHGIDQLCDQLFTTQVDLPPLTPDETLAKLQQLNDKLEEIQMLIKWNQQNEHPQCSQSYAIRFENALRAYQYYPPIDAYLKDCRAKQFQVCLVSISEQVQGAIAQIGQLEKPNNLLEFESFISEAHRELPIRRGGFFRSEKLVDAIIAYMEHQQQQTATQKLTEDKRLFRTVFIEQVVGACKLLPQSLILPPDIISLFFTDQQLVQQMEQRQLDWIKTARVCSDLLLATNEAAEVVLDRLTSSS